MVTEIRRSITGFWQPTTTLTAFCFFCFKKKEVKGEFEVKPICRLNESPDGDFSNRFL